MNDIDIIEQLTIAVEQAGVNLAPTYQEYMPFAFALANIFYNAYLLVNRFFFCFQ